MSQKKNFTVLKTLIQSDCSSLELKVNEAEIAKFCSLATGYDPSKSEVESDPKKKKVKVIINPKSAKNSKTIAKKN